MLLFKKHFRPLDKLMFTGLLSTVLGACSVGAITGGCSPAANKAAKTVVDMTTASCVILRGAVSDTLTDTICATEEELAPIVKHLFAARKAQAVAGGKVGAASSAKHPDELPPTKGVDACMVEK